MARELGVFLGEFHLQGKRFRKILKSRRKFYDLNPAVMKKTERYAFNQNNLLLKLVVHDIKSGVEKNRPPAGLPRGPIHVDIKPENELFVKNKLSAVVDFGNFYVGPLMVDVGKTIMWNCCGRGKFDKNLFKSFMNGYKSKRRLTKKEFSYLKKSILFAIYSHIWVDLYHVPLKYVPESYTLFLVKNFLPVATQIENMNFNANLNL
jgi:Ser/Thr protein kinase RdoA (MazF antagonist)